MLRSSLLVATAATLILVGSAQGQRSRCPFNAQAQISVSMSMQRQMAMNQSAVNNQMRYLSLQRNALPTQMSSSPLRMNASITNYHGTALRLNTQRLLMPRTATMCRTIPATPMRLTGTLARYSQGTPSMASTARHAVQRRTLVSRQNTFVTTVRKAPDVSRTVNVARQSTFVTPQRQVGVAPQNTFVTQQRKMHTERRKEMVERHSPNVQVRINLSMTCGGCHNCPKDRVVMALPSRMPTFDRSRPPLDRSSVLLPAPGTVVRRPGPPLLPAVVQRPALQRPFPVLVAERPRPILTLTVFRPPTLPPLTVARDRPRSPVDRLLIQPPTRASLPGLEGLLTAPTTLERAAVHPVLGGEPPPLKGLEGTAGQINPLLGADKMLAGQRAGAADPAGLAPDTVRHAPALAPLAATRHLERGLLPTLDAEDHSELEALDEADRPRRLGLVLEAPPLPPLPDMILR